MLFVYRTRAQFSPVENLLYDSYRYEEMIDEMIQEQIFPTPETWSLAAGRYELNAK